MRNSSTLLFSALVTRIFGVKRERDEFASKNCMTTRAFFQRYPRLYTTFFYELENAAKEIRKSRGCVSPVEAALYPVLIILAKLIPSQVSTGPDEFQVGVIFEISTLRNAALVPFLSRVRRLTQRE